VRWSGWALVIGAILFATGLVFSLATSDNSVTRFERFFEAGTYTGVLLGEILFVVGLLGLRAGYAGRSGGLGAGLLVAAILGATLSLIGLVALIARSSEEFGWYWWSLGFLTLTVALAAYGVVAIQRHVFSRWNFAPLLAGVTALVLFATFIGLEVWGYPVPFLLALSVTCLGLVLIGYRMQADVTSTSSSVA
jgi:hypothetical protein